MHNYILGHGHSGVKIILPCHFCSIHVYSNKISVSKWGPILLCITTAKLLHVFTQLFTDRKLMSILSWEETQGTFLLAAASLNSGYFGCQWDWSNPHCTLCLQLFATSWWFKCRLLRLVFSVHSLYPLCLSQFSCSHHHTYPIFTSSFFSYILLCLGEEKLWDLLGGGKERSCLELAVLLGVLPHCSPQCFENYWIFLLFIKITHLGTTE